MAAPDKPAPVSLNLDTVEREGGDRPPFVFTLGGKRIQLADALELDWKILITAEKDPPQFYREAIMDDEQRKHFFAQKIPGWKMQRLMRSYFEHYGINPEALAAS